MPDENGTEATQDAQNAYENLFGDTAADPAVAVAEEQEAKDSTGQEAQGSHAAENQDSGDESGPADDQTGGAERGPAENEADGDESGSPEDPASEGEGGPAENEADGDESGSPEDPASEGEGGPAENEAGRNESDPAEDQAGGGESGQPEDLKVVVLIREGNATIGVQRPSSDPHIESFDDPDLSGLAREVSAVIERARAKWEDSPRYPAYTRPNRSTGRRSRREQGPAQDTTAEEGAAQDQPQTLRLF